MKALYAVTTKYRGERTDVDWACYNMVATSALEAIKKAERKYAVKGAEYATEVKVIGKID